MASVAYLYKLLKLLIAFVIYVLTVLYAVVCGNGLC